MIIIMIKVKYDNKYDNNDNKWNGLIVIIIISGSKKSPRVFSFIIIHHRNIFEILHTAN